MEDEYGPLLLDTELSAQQRDALQDYLQEHPDLAGDLARWREIRRELGRQMQQHLVDRRLLVLYALEEQGHGEVLTAEEEAKLDEVRPDIEAAIDAHPALEHVVERIEAERDDFETVWEQHWTSSPEAESAKTEASDRRSKRSARQPARSGGAHPLRSLWRLGFALVLLVAAGLVVFYGAQAPSTTTVSVAEGEQRVVDFDDGSTVRLVGEATLEYPSDASPEEGRQVTLKRGRAYFDVVARDGAEFVVATPTAIATVLGTQFGVTAQNDTTEVVLVEGAVEVDGIEGDIEPVVLKPGQRSIVERGRSPSDPTSVDLTSALGWSGLFVFRSTPMEHIAQRLSQHYEVSISVGPVLADESVTGTFEREQPVSEILGALARTLGAQVHRENGAYQIEPSS